MEPVFHTIPLSSLQNDTSDEAFMQEMTENTLKYKTFNKHEVKYLYHSLIDNCIYFLETTYESLYASQYTFNHQKFHTFAENIIRKARITIPLLYSIMYYIKRFRSAVRNCPKAILNLEHGLTIQTPEDLNKLFVTAAIISLKFFNDRVIMNVEWKKFIQASVEDINLYERQFFQFINYNLNLNVDHYYIFINDYLHKFNSKSKSFPTRSYNACGSKTNATTTTTTQSLSSISQPIITVSAEDADQNASTVNPNPFLSITPTPSHGGQSSPYDTLPAPMNTTNIKPLTPNEEYIEQTSSTQKVMYHDPMSIDELSPPEQYNSYRSYTQFPKNDTECTLYNHCNGCETTMPSYACHSPSYGDAQAFQSNSNRTLNNPGEAPIMNTNSEASLMMPPPPMRTPQQEEIDNLSNLPFTYAGQPGRTLYHPSEDEMLREHLHSTKVPLNKLLYSLHHYHIKQQNACQQQQDYSSKEEMNSIVEEE